MKAFISYAHHDKAALERLHTHLRPLQRDGHIDWWHDNDILAGGELDREISEQLENCELFIALVSPDFLASNYCYEREMRRAVERCEEGTLRIVSIIIEPCYWKSTPLAKFKVLPDDGRAVSEWPNPNNAYLNVVEELRRIVEDEPIEAPSNSTKQTAAPEDAPHVQKATPTRYRARRDFDEIDRADFRKEAFATFSEFFKESVAEVDRTDGLRGRFQPIEAGGFTCTVVNRNLQRNRDAHITVRMSAGRGAGFGDIYYSFSENAPENSANGWFSIASDDYELFLERIAMMGNQDDRMSPQQAAEALWKEFIAQAGIDYD